MQYTTLCPHTLDKLANRLCRACATHCHTLQHNATPATHCNTLQHTATHCNTLLHTATHCNTHSHTPCCNTLPRTAAWVRVMHEFMWERVVLTLYSKEAYAMLQCVAVRLKVRMCFTGRIREGVVTKCVHGLNSSKCTTEFGWTCPARLDRERDKRERYKEGDRQCQQARESNKEGERQRERDKERERQREREEFSGVHSRFYSLCNFLCVCVRERERERESDMGVREEGECVLDVGEVIDIIVWCHRCHCHSQFLVMSLVVSLHRWCHGLMSYMSL